MKEKTKALIDSIKPLLEVCLKYSDRLQLDQIHIATGRARDILKLIGDVEKELPKKTNNQNFLIKYLDNKIKV